MIPPGKHKSKPIPTKYDFKNDIDVQALSGREFFMSVGSAVGACQAMLVLKLVKSDDVIKELETFIKVSDLSTPIGQNLVLESAQYNERQTSFVLQLKEMASEVISKEESSN